MNNNLEFLKNKGFDVEVGISFLGDENMYIEILSDFKNGFINQMNDIKSKYEQRDIDNYSILVHALKSNCKTLGISSLATLAYDHEMKSKEHDQKYIDEHINELFIKANEIYRIMEEFFSEKKE